MQLTVDLHKNFVEVLSPVARPQPRNPLLSDLSREQRTKPIPPKPNRFVADLDAALIQQVFDVAPRQRVSNIHHNRQADDIGRRLEVPERAALGHQTRLGDRHAPLNNFVLTVPPQIIVHSGKDDRKCHTPPRTHPLKLARNSLTELGFRTFKLKQ